MLTDNSLMTFGVHKGKRMIDVPEKYLVFIYQSGALTAEVRAYIEANVTIPDPAQKKDPAIIKQQMLNSKIKRS